MDQTNNSDSDDELYDSFSSSFIIVDPNDCEDDSDDDTNSVTNSSSTNFEGQDWDTATIIVNSSLIPQIQNPRIRGRLSTLRRGVVAQEQDQNDTGLGDSLVEGNDGDGNEQLTGIACSDDDDEFEDLDVVDGVDGHSQTPGSGLANVSFDVSTYNPDELEHDHDDSIPIPPITETQGQSENNTRSTNLSSPPGPSRTQIWIDNEPLENGNSSDADVEEKLDEDPLMLMYSLFINLWRDKIPDKNLVYGDPTNVEENLEACLLIHRVIGMLQMNNIPEALMEVINYIWSPEISQEEGVQEKKKNSQRILLRALSFALPTKPKFDLDASTIEKLLAYDILEDPGYYIGVNLCEGIRYPSTKHHVYERVQNYMNNLIYVTWECKRVIFDFNLREIQTVISEVNAEKDLYLSPDKEAKYGKLIPEELGVRVTYAVSIRQTMSLLLLKLAGDLYHILRTQVSDRCLKFLKFRGFNFLATETEDEEAEAAPLMSQEEPRSSQEQEDMSQRQQYSMGSQELQLSSQGSQGSNSSGRIIASLFGSPNNSQGSQISSQSSLQSLSNGGRSGIGEDSFELQSRASQSSIENQGYASSSSANNSQYSVPRMSQSPRGDSEPDMQQRYAWNPESTYINLPSLSQNSTDSEGSMGPSLPKRPRHNYY